MIFAISSYIYHWGLACSYIGRLQTEDHIHYGIPGSSKTRRLGKD